MNKNWWQRLRPDQQVVIMELGCWIFGIIWLLIVGSGIYRIFTRSAW